MKLRVPFRHFPEGAYASHRGTFFFVPLPSRIPTRAVFDGQTQRLIGIEIIKPYGQHGELIVETQFDEYAVAMSKLPHMPDVRDAFTLARDVAAGRGTNMKQQAPTSGARIEKE